jgi:hypothetical protein
MKIADSVRKAIDDWESQDYESSMMHACNAVDGTAQKVYPSETSSNLRFTTYIRKYFDLISAMVIPDVDLGKTRWPVHVSKPKAPGGGVDFADMIYGIHRCCHNHGNEIPDGNDILPNLKKTDQPLSYGIKNGSIQLSDHVVWALLIIVILDPVNALLADAKLDHYYFTLGKQKLHVNEWWGRLDELPKPPKPRGVLDFSDLT